MRPVPHALILTRPPGVYVLAPGAAVRPDRRHHGAPQWEEPAGRGPVHGSRFIFSAAKLLNKISQNIAVFSPLVLYIYIYIINSVFFLLAFLAANKHPHTHTHTHAHAHTQMQDKGGDVLVLSHSLRSSLGACLNFLTPLPPSPPLVSLSLYRPSAATILYFSCTTPSSVLCPRAGHFPP